MNVINLPTDLLRSFITVSDLGGYTKAGHVLNRTQPAVSLQMRRLEDLLDARLFVQNGKSLELTEAGKKLSVYARQILHLNDDAISQFKPKHATGGIRIGLPTDFAVSNLQDVVVKFSQTHPDVDLEICCDLSRNLLKQLHTDEINLAVALVAEDGQQYLIHSWEEQPVWAIGCDVYFDPKNPAPLVGHPKNCEYRKRMTEALEKNGRKWRLAYTSPDISGVQDAVEAGLGISALTNATLTKNMKKLGPNDGFPQLANIKIGLFYKLPRVSESGQELARDLLERIEDVTNQRLGWKAR